MSETFPSVARKRIANGWSAAPEYARRRASSSADFLSLAIIAAALCATGARAHQGAVPMTFWGDNLRAVDARCQLEIGAGAATCGYGAWQVRRTCLLDRLDGKTCDDDADRRAVEALRLAVFRGRIDPSCQQANLNSLFFSDAQDVQFDVVTFCRELEAAAVSVVFNPFFAAGDTDLDDAAKECVRAFADVTTKAFRYTFRIRKVTLDRIAHRRRSARIKNNNVASANSRVAAASASLRKALLERCSEESFQSVYNLTTEQAIHMVASRSACLTDRTYPVIAFECPESVCGNGMVEPGERCDDGNTVSGDGCSSTCQLEF